MDYKKILGHHGEAIIENYLKKNGYKIVDKNYLKRSGEIDLIAQDPEGNEIVFIEVKTRRSYVYGRPEEAVNNKKIRNIEKTAILWMAEKNKSNLPWRIDIIALELMQETKIIHLKNVTL